MSANLPRRTVLLSGLATLLVPWSSGCGPGPGPVTPPSPPLPALHTSPLADLVAAGGLRWILLAAPRELLNVPWIPPLVDLAVSGARFDRFARVTGIDLRTIPEAIVTSTTSKSDEEVLFYLARHTGDPAFIERSFRARLTSEEKRSVDRPDLIRVSGKVGRAPNAAVLIGPDIVGFQEAGSMSRGPARVAALFAEQKLKSAHTALAVDPIRSLAMKLGPAPLSAFAPGPFEGDLARGLRGLLGAATGIGGVLRPSVRQGFFVTLAVSGDFATSSGPAGSELMAAWNDLAQSRLGHVLGLDAPLTAPSIALAPDAVGLSVELSGRALADGLARLTATRVEDIFR